MKYILLATLMLGTLLRSAAQDLGWAAQLGGTLFDHSYAVAVNDSGHVYSTGSFEGFADLNPGPVFDVFLSAGDADVFVSKLDKDGSLLWALTFGGSTEDYGEALALDGDGNVYVAGYFNGTSDFEPGADVTNLTSAGDYDAFLSKFNADGDFLWAIRLGGTSADQVRDMAVDTAGNILLVGQFSGTADFDPGAGDHNLASEGGNDIFVVKLNDAGELIWATSFGDTGDDIARGVAIDPENNVLTTGRFAGTVDFNIDAGVANLISNGMEDVFITKVNEDAVFQWAVQIGAALPDEGTAIHADDAGHVYTAGFFQETADFDPGVDAFELTSFGAEDIFISVLDADGAFIMARQMGGAGLEKAHAIDTDTAGNIYTSGYFAESADFDPGSSDFVLTSAGGLDAFVSKLNADGEFQWAAQFGGPDEDRSLDMVVGDSAFVYTSGHFNGAVDFDPGAGDFILTSFGATDAYIVVLEPCYPTYSETSVTSCDSYTSPDGLEVWTESGTYVDTLVLFGGCDSIITVQLTIINSTSSEISETACDSYTSPDGLEIWTVSGTYLDTLDNSVGCDSIITVHLTILNSTTSEIFVTECDSYISPDGLDKWSVSGTYLDTLINAVGCDSIITVQLTINNSTESEITVEACESYTSPDGLEIWTTSGTYVDTIPNAIGCDSVITIQLSIFTNTTAEITVEACESFPSPSGQFVWTESGIYNDTIPNTGGCDSIITINLTINLNTSSTLDLTACDSLVSPGGQVWTTSGVYQDVIPNEAGCDSNMIITLTIIHSSTSEITVTACDSYSLPGGTQTWTESGIYQDTIPNAVGCDSVVTVNLTINISPSLQIVAEACDSYLSPTGTQTWTESGIYQEIIPLPGECDSIITVDLTINHSDTVELTVDACESYLSPDGTEVWTLSGTYLDTIPTAAGCDSFMTIILTILSPSASEITMEACDSFSLPGGTQTWTESGIYMDTIPNAFGCDSVVTINLTINISPGSEITTEACDSYTTPSGDLTWSESGTYYEYIPVGGACDSIVTYHLTILQSTSSTIDATACDSYISPDGEEVWTESGVYQDTISNAIGCDSIVTINLTINITPASELTVDACDRYTLPGGTQTWTESGVYQEIFDTAGECDSVVTVNLTIHLNTTADLTLTACDSYVSPSTNYVWTESGIYLDTIANTGGCDSVMTIDLTIINLDASVTQDETILTADMAGVSYQWIDCDNANQPIDGETSQQFSASATGNYAVIVTSGDCVDTSACYNVIIVGTKDVQIFSDLKVYPNPASDHFVIEPGRLIGNGVITVSDLQGREVYSAPYLGEDRVVVSFDGPAGMYVVALTNATYRIIGKVMIE
jgi:hypothetical protein